MSRLESDHVRAGRAEERYRLLINCVLTRNNERSQECPVIDHAGAHLCIRLQSFPSLVNNTNIIAPKLGVGHPCVTVHLGLLGDRQSLTTGCLFTGCYTNLTTGVYLSLGT